MTAQMPFPFATGRAWWVVTKYDPRARALADRHYSRRTVGGDGFMACGRTLVMLTLCGRAVWGAVENLDPVGGLHWRISIFRNEGTGRLSSELVREGTELTAAWWRLHYGGLPPVPLRTEIDVSEVRPKRDPGRCFRRAGWRVVESARGDARGLVVLEAPSVVFQSDT